VTDNTEENARRAADVGRNLVAVVAMYAASEQAVMCYPAAKEWIRYLPWRDHRIRAHLARNDGRITGRRVGHHRPVLSLRFLEVVRRRDAGLGEKAVRTGLLHLSPPPWV